jgi:CheY-like chemotaxis protein
VSQTTPSRRPKHSFKTGEVAELCGMAQQTVIRLCRKGELIARTLPGSSHRRIAPEDLIRFMREHQIPLNRLRRWLEAHGLYLEGVTGWRSRVLAVDDNEALLDIIVEALERDGRFEVETASTAYTAGRLMAQFHPDLVLLDYKLPDRNADEILAEMSAEHVKVIIISGVVGPEKVQPLLDAGADAFLRKPFDVEELITLISKLLAE